jgi:hypothetical protein
VLNSVVLAQNREQARRWICTKCWGTRTKKENKNKEEEFELGAAINLMTWELCLECARLDRRPGNPRVGDGKQEDGIFIL